MQSLPAPPLQPATQTCCYCHRELPLVTRVVSPPNPRVNAGTQSRCTICWLLEDLDRAWTEDFGPVPREVIDKCGEFLAKALEELMTFQAAPPGWAAAAATSSPTQTADDENVHGLGPGAHGLGPGAHGFWPSADARAPSNI